LNYELRMVRLVRNSAMRTFTPIKAIIILFTISNGKKGTTVIV
jgi:hypothetical protein